ncbi:MAG TPA: methyltransferase [Trebonia sp.]|nr:methyltransferase [Trebonia sp.]
MATESARARIDLGRIFMVPVAALMLTLDLTSLTHHLGGGVAGALGWLGAAGVCAFYLLIIWCYLRRGPAVATTRSVTAHVAAVVATFAPFAFPLLRTAAPPGTARQLAADLLLLAGTAWSVWSLRFLGRNLSVLAQARDIVDHGPYRWIRHPLYAGEIVSGLGLAITAGSAAAAALWLTLCTLHGYRALREEQVLLRALPGYRAYRARTAALLPGIF